MASIPLPALGVKAPEAPNMLDAIHNALAIKSMQQGQALQQQQLQGAQMENQQRQQSLQDQQNFRNYTSSLQPGASFDESAVLKAAGPVLGPQIIKQHNDMLKSHADLQDTQGKVQAGGQEYVANLARAIQQAKYDPTVAQTMLDAAAQIPGYGPQVQQLKQVLGQNPAQFNQIIDSVIAQSPKQATAGKDMAQGALATAQIPGAQAKSTQDQRILTGMTPTGVTADQQQRFDLQKLQDEWARQHGNQELAMQKRGQDLANEGMQLSPEALNMLSNQYATTGNLPPMGMGKGGAKARAQVFNATAAANPGIVPASVGAVFAADKKSLTALQTNFDQVSAFESTAGKNLDVFLNQAKNLVDSGSPIINAPVRMLNEKVVGSQNMAAINTARTTALTEIAKVLNSSNASGVLSDSARHEVEGLIGKDATLGQIYSAANILKQDMANRHQSYSDQIAEIKKRMGGGTGQGAAPGAQQQQAAPTHRYNPQTGKIEAY